MRLKKEGNVRARDLILALTADEEGGSSNGVDWLLREHRDWIDAEYCINLDGGEFEKDKDKRLLAGIQASEKVYVDFQFESLNPGGHSSVPSPDNAVYHLAGAVSRWQSYSFSVKINEITRSYFDRNAALKTRQVAADKNASVPAAPGSNAGHGENSQRHLAGRSSRRDYGHRGHGRKVHAHRRHPDLWHLLHVF